MCCCPFANFSDEDIWAYIFKNELEYLHIYDYPYLDRRRNRNEITLLYNDWLINSGMIYHYEMMYPEFFAWLKKKYPLNDITEIFNVTRDYVYKIAKENNLQVNDTEE